MCTFNKQRTVQKRASLAMVAAILMVGGILASQAEAAMLTTVNYDFSDASQTDSFTTSTGGVVTSGNVSMTHQNDPGRDGLPGRISVASTTGGSWANWYYDALDAPLEAGQTIIHRAFFQLTATPATSPQFTPFRIHFANNAGSSTIHMGIQSPNGDSTYNFAISNDGVEQETGVVVVPGIWYQMVSSSKLVEVSGSTGTWESTHSLYDWSTGTPDLVESVNKTADNNVNLQQPRLQLYYASSHGAVLMDDIGYQVIPEPGTISLAMGGLTLLLLRRRVR